MHKGLLIASLILFLSGLFSIWASNVGSTPNEDLSTGFAMVLLDFGGLALWFVAFIFFVFGLVLKENKQQVIQTPLQPPHQQLVDNFRCKVCEAQVRRTQTFCSNCGRTLEWETQQITGKNQVAESIFYCKVCGAQIERSQKYCGNCGRVLEWENKST